MLFHRHWHTRAGNSCDMDVNPEQLPVCHAARHTGCAQSARRARALLSRQTPRGAVSVCVTYLTLVGLLSCVYQIVLLEVSQLCEAFIASLAFKWSLSAVYSEVHLGRNKAINNWQFPVTQ